MEHYVSFSWWYHLQQCGHTRGILWESDVCFQRCPTCLHWCSNQRCSHTHWRAPQGVHPALGAAWETGEDGGSPKLIPQLGEGVATLPASCCSGTCPTSLWGNEMMALPPELWGKESSMPKGRRPMASRAGQMRFTLTWVSRTNTCGGPAPGFEEVTACL